MRHAWIAALPALILLAACGERDDAAAPTAEDEQPGDEIAAAPETGDGLPPTPVPDVAEGLTGRNYEATADLSGYYLPETERVVSGTIELDHISIGLDWQFEEYLAAPEDAYAPVQIVFVDVSSEMIVNEMGQESYAGSYVVWPDAFLISDERLLFVGHDPELGEIRFEGQFDSALVEADDRDMPGESGGALTGTLAVGEDRIEGIRFMVYMGD